MAKGKKPSIGEQKAKLSNDPVMRRQVFKEICDHVAQGKSLDCYYLLSIESIYEYMKKYPLEFIEEDLKAALRKGKDGWEDIGRRQANGSCLGNSRSWYYNMANRYGWREKIDIEAEHKGSVAVNVVSYASEKARKEATTDQHE